MLKTIVSFFQKKQLISFPLLQKMLNELELGDSETIGTLLWQPKTSMIKYLPVTYEMLLQLKRPAGNTQNLSVYKTHSSKNFSLLILELPWIKDQFKCSPIIIENKTCKIVGIMLPFNELHDTISPKEDNEIGELGLVWTGFVIENRFK